MESDFAQLVTKIFGIERVVCLLFYGSNAFNRSERKSSDYDFYLMLDSFQTGDYKKLKRLTKDFTVNIDLTFQYLADLETRGWSNYQLGNHGLFYILNFSQAITLLGHNIFQRKLIGLNSESIIKSVLFQIQEYFWRLDNWSLKEPNKQLLVDEYKKYLIRIITDILLLKEDISFSEINTHRYEDTAKLMEYKNYFSNSTKKIIKETFISKNYELEKLQLLQRSIYQDYLNLYH